MIVATAASTSAGVVVSTVSLDMVGVCAVALEAAGESECARATAPAIAGTTVTGASVLARVVNARARARARARAAATATDRATAIGSSWF